MYKITATCSLKSLSFALVLCGFLFAEEAVVPQTPPSKAVPAGKEVIHTGCVAPAVKFTRFNEQWAFLAGGRVGYLLMSQFSIGLEGYQLISPVESSLPGSPELDLRYGGIYLDWVYRPFELVHGGFSLLTGRGQVDLEEGTGDPDDFFVLEPQWFFQGNVTPFLQVVWGFSYRLVLGSNRMIDASAHDNWFDLSQLATGVQLKLGWFQIDYLE